MKVDPKMLPAGPSPNAGTAMPINAQKVVNLIDDNISRPNQGLREIARQQMMTGDKIRDSLVQKMDDAVAYANAYVRENQSFHGISFAYQENSGLSYAIVKDEKSGQVLRTIPGPEFLVLAARLREASHLLMDVKA